ncbi:hypothetical protein KQI38_09460 [Tissierella carlieri]|uniref:hypothetical protein n=1 Tax=Tissierella TaxID=41273 RepID=UPI000BA050D0|nr:MULTISPECIES: hypothetical protein [Tissierella]MBU5312254.1 hypothetical protein [Tissierella carlieri]OZV13700.1 hypothetical protein CIW83_01800 [Tissierella sp. P1]
MTISYNGGYFQNISQRAAYEYCMAFSDYTSMVSEGLDYGIQEHVESSYKDLHKFFGDLYDELFYHPENFYLPTTEDMAYEDFEPKESRPEVTKAWYKPKTEIKNGLEFLYAIGQVGVINQQNLLLSKEQYNNIVKKSKVKKQFIKSMQCVELHVIDEEENIIITNTRYPKMMPALKQLAVGCQQHKDEMGFIYFYQCNFKAINPNYEIDAPTILKKIATIQYDKIILLHNYLINQGYKAICKYPNISYQGSRKSKSTPLLVISFDPRAKETFGFSLKLASINRLIPHIYNQPDFLQEDFNNRTRLCTGCGWCNSRDGMNPSVFEYKGETKTLCCWYSFIIHHHLDDELFRVIKQYSILHQMLAS